ncbi:MAG: phage baseplate assembly protein V [Pseudodesulfovibrio sp.]|uniref:Phage baseplate assembly protein V n=1 Tax=Pseudodesulfovibrio aespoeensis (strain ATCC 700646 / DSM 10631 / Aspo-2) TaxID=643562 RepID=E6VU87_PSEA9|nr:MULTISPECIES: phage baseplate assembly protein V [Pseudodesulfovibrio]MBU4191328.1 phage baseplate assembly protein V [Pseudomonadota bacterium]ADU63394.1 phage baseplate assembly protein V [Pseudodesulfovibrio aespoeensis Aspo-2]MBU4243442.1 phage baseplate assembly protein V [Pseudomonadota bacterium]MBU4377470.1 phage baseplate assembly protein V [Pseudomonadota bacterium]MBU4473776.1 phage baseplate assembly protein V [Pseudomonadota bacterium]
MRALSKLLAPIRRRLSMVVTRAVITLTDDGALMQAMQARLLAGEVMDGLERFQEYGFTSVPHPGAEGIALSVGGQRSNTVLIAVDDRRYRLKGLKNGEVALYTDEGDRIHFGRGGIVTLKAATRLILDTPEVITTGGIRAAGDILDQTTTGNTRTVRGMREVYNGHTHPGDSGGVTGGPYQEQ